ncbi:MAG: hypothetical protein JWM57_1702 [Phycisphaerales bacterium]|nr:hypothetical protein [Phycisphaerales bacterium]
MKRIAMTLALLSLFGTGRCFAADVVPAEAAAATTPREATLKAVTVVFHTVHTTRADASADFSKAFNALRETLKTAGITPSGETMIILHAPFGEGPMTADAGFVVPEGTKAPEGEHVKALPAAPSIASVYFGSMAGLSATIGQLFMEAGQAGKAPGNEIRQHMLHWEGAESPNNVILVELTLRP